MDLQDLTPQQKRKLEKLAAVVADGDLAIVEHLFEIEELFENKVAEVKESVPDLDKILETIKGKPGNSVKGDDGHTPTPEELKALIKPLIPAPVPYKLSDSDKTAIIKQLPEKIIEKTEVIREQPIVTEITKETVREVALTDTPDEVLGKVNTSKVLIKKDRIEGLADIERIARANSEASLPATTSFINGKRAKNINFTGATVTHHDDTATVAITSGTGSAHTIQDEGTPLTTRTNLNFVGSGVSVTDDAGNDTTVVTISGAAANFADNEIVSGSATTFTLANTPVLGSQKVFGAGTRLKPGVLNDYTISGAVITIINGTYSAGEIIADYRY